MPVEERLAAINFLVARGTPCVLASSGRMRSGPPRTCPRAGFLGRHYFILFGKSGSLFSAKNVAILSAFREF